jgi:acyl-coenzyme A thioesterase PaaI-like protein
MTIAERDRGAGEIRGVFEDSHALISYRYLGCWSEAVDREHAVGHMRIRSDMRTGSGGLRAAPLAIAMLDTAGISIDGSYHAACSHIDVHLLDPGREIAEIRIVGSVVREARTAVFTEAQFERPDRPGDLFAVGTVGWSIIGPTPPGFVYTHPGNGFPDAPNLPPLEEAYEAIPTGDGGYSIPGLSARIGTDVLHHGPVLVSTESAALNALAAAAGTTDLDIETSSTRLVRAGRRGPFVARADCVGRIGDVLAARVEMRDLGSDDQLIATAFVRARIAGSTP